VDPLAPEGMELMLPVAVALAETVTSVVLAGVVLSVGLGRNTRQVVKTTSAGMIGPPGLTPEGKAVSVVVAVADPDAEETGMSEAEMIGPPGFTPEGTCESEAEMIGPPGFTPEGTCESEDANGVGVAIPLTKTVEDPKVSDVHGVVSVGVGAGKVSVRQVV